MSNFLKTKKDEEAVEQVNNQSSPTPEMALLDELKKVKEETDQQYEKSSNADIWLKLAEDVNKAMAMRDQSKALSGTKISGFSPMGTDFKMDTSSSKNVLDNRKSKIESLLSEYKLRQSLKPAGPKMMEVGGRVVSVDPTTGTAKELYKPEISAEELAQKEEDRELEREAKQLNIQKLEKELSRKPGDDLTSEQKEAAMVDLQLKQAELQKRKLENDQNPEISSMQRIKMAADINRAMAENEISRKRLEQMDQPKQLTDLEKAKVDESRAKTKMYEAKANPPTSTKLSEGEKVLDREFAKVYNEWSTGGKADYEENSKIFKQAIDSLKKGKVDTGGLSGIGSKLPGVRTDTKEMETRVRKAINGMLRATLGAQFTEAEGEKVFSQTFDPFASPQANIENMQTELNKLEKRRSALDSQGAYFKKNKTLSGFGDSFISEPKQADKNNQEEIKTKIIDGKPVQFKKTANGWEQIL